MILFDVVGFSRENFSLENSKFKNIKNIKNAGLDELMTISGINEKIAQQITSYKT